MKQVCWIFLLLPLCWSLSCNKKSDPPVRKVSADQLAMIPYKEGQMVRFAGPDGDTITTQVIVERSYDALSDSSGMFREEYISWQLKRLGDNATVATFSAVLRAPHQIAFVLFSPLRNFETGRGFDILITPGAPDFYCNGLTSLYVVLTCMPTVNIGDIEYEDALLVEAMTDANLGPDQLKTMYYNKTSGILQFTYEKGQTYTLVP